MRWYARAIVDRPRTVLVAVAIVTLVLGAESLRLQRALRMRDVLPSDHPNVRVYNRIDDLFQVEGNVLLVVRPREGDVFQHDFLAVLASVTHDLERLPGIVAGSVLGLASKGVRRVVVRGDDLDVQPLLPETPLDEPSLEALRAEVLGSPLYRGLLVSEDRRWAAIVGATDGSVPLIEFRQQLEGVAERARSAGVEVVLGGVPVLTAYIEEYAGRAGVLLLLTILLVAVVHYEAFRTIQAMALPLVTAIVSVVLSLGAMALMGWAVDPWNAAAPLIILAIAAGHAVQVLKRYYEEVERRSDNREAIVESLAAVGPVMLTAGGIAAAGFASLATFSIPSVRVFGLLLAFGIVAALFTELTLIPAVRALLPPPARRERLRAVAGSRLTRGIDVLARLVLRAPRAIIAATIGFMLLALLGASRIEVNNSYRDWFYPGSVPRESDDVINDAFGGTSTVQLLLEGDAPGALEEPAVLQAVADTAGTLAATPGIGKVVSYVDFVRQFHSEMSPDDAGSLPKTRNGVAQDLLVMEMGGTEALSSFLDATHRYGVLTAFSRNDEARFGHTLVENLRAFVASRFNGLPVRVHVAGGTIGAQTAVNEVVVAEKVHNVLQVSLVIFVLSSLALRSIVGGLLVLAPLTLAVLTNLGLMGWCGIWLSLNTATVTALGISIGADFSIYLLFRIREELASGRPLERAIEAALSSAGHAICFVSSAIVVGYLALVLGGLRTWTYFGELTALMVSMSALASVTIVPALCLILRPRFLGVEAIGAGMPVEGAVR